MRRVRFMFGALLAMLWMAPLRAQEPTGTVRGRVTDDATQQPLAGAAISVGSHRAQTDAEGRYVITGLPAGTDSLRARMLGYLPVNRVVTMQAGQTVLVDVAMTAQAIQLSAIVAVGYGEQRAGDITGAVSNLTPADFNTGQIISPEQLVESKVAGVQVIDNNDPGGGMSIRIRGATSITASSDPLYVVDGVPLGTGSGGGISAGRDPLNFLNPDDIASITVLKDASAAAIYGTNAANGVVIITTKSGEGHGPRIEYSGSMSSSSITKIPSMLNAAQFRVAVDSFAPQNVSQLANANTDWFGLIDRTGFGQNHNLVVSGSGLTNSYRLSLGYMDQNGVIKASSVDRLSLGFNYDQRLFGDQLDVKTNLKGSREMDQFTPGGVLSNAAQMGPTQPVYDSTAGTGYYNWPGNTLVSADNPLEILNLSQALGSTFRSVGNVQADWSLPFLPALHANVNLGYDLTKVTSESFYPNNIHQQTKNASNGSYYRADNTQANTVVEGYLNYAAPLNIVPGSIDVTGGYSYQRSHAEYPSLSLGGLDNNQLGLNGIVKATNVYNYLDIEESKLISFFGRVNYNLNDKYIVAASLRRDGSSRFSPNNAWGTFPSVSAAWRISQEPFLRDISALSDLKLRASWAETGNQSFGNYLYATTFLASNPQAQVAWGQGNYVGTIRPSAVDPNIRWEQTKAWNLGVDYGFFNQRLSGSIDYYVKNTSNLINFVPIDPATNLSNYVTTNVGSMQNKGLELSLSAEVFRGGPRKIGWTADFTAATNSNKITAITPWGGASQQIQVGSISGGVGSYIQIDQAGSPINSFYVCRQFYNGTTGKPVQGEFYYAHADSTFTVTPGNSCDSRGLVVEHSPAPTWILGHTSYLTYGPFDLSFTLRAWIGNYVYNNVASNLGTYAEVGRASPYNLSSSVLKTGFTAQEYLSDIYLEDASFLRMDNLSVGYNFEYRGAKMRLFGTVQNVFTITGYNGVDPTAGLNGIDNNIYPRARTVTGGLTVRF